MGSHTDRAEPGRRPLAARDGRADRRLPRRARASSARRSSATTAAARSRRSSTASHPERVERLVAHQLRHVRALPAVPCSRLLPPLVAHSRAGCRSLAAAVPDRRRSPRFSYDLLANHEIDRRARRRSGSSRSLARPGRAPRHAQAHLRDAQAPHARGGREAARVRAPGAIRLGRRGPLLQASRDAERLAAMLPDAEIVEIPARRRSSRSTSLTASPTRSHFVSGPARTA